MSNMSQLMALMLRPIPHIIMSASTRKDDIKTVSGLLGRMNPTDMHASLEMRDTTVTCHISENPSSSLKTSAHRDLVENSRYQQIWYTNSRKNAEGSLLDMAQTMLDIGQPGFG